MDNTTNPQIDEDGMIVVRSRAEIPTHFESEDEEARWWETHELTEEALPTNTPAARQRLEKARSMLRAGANRAEPGTVAINIRIESDVLERLRNLAEARGLGYQTLLKRFVVERLYEEERRAAP
jgi:predicted DNA binding CopG/RHH family protein